MKCHASILLGLACMSCDLFGPGSVTVTGTVVIREPVPNVPVMILGYPPVTTDADGRFRVDGVKTPYDVAFAVDGGGTAVVYRGLTRSDPRLVIPALYVGPGALGGTISGTVSGGSPATVQVGGTITVPLGYQLAGKSLSLLFDRDPSPPAQYDLSGQVSGDTVRAFSYVAPVVPGAGLAIRALGAAGNGVVTTVRRAVPTANASGISIVLPEAPLAVSPADSATGVSGPTVFAWTLVAGAGSRGRLYPRASGTAVWIVTGAAQATVPDLSALGVARTPSTSYTWVVQAVGLFADVDAVAGPNDFAPLGDVLYAASAPRRLMTAP